MTEYASRHLVAGDRPLRRDLRLLGWQVRRLVVEHGGEAAWRTTKDLRDLAELRRSDGHEAEQRMAEMIRRTPTDQLVPVIQATRIFFDLANLAEDRHRVRVLRRRRASGRLSETIEHAVRTMQGEGLSHGQVADLIRRVEVEPVLTAHPTEAKRRSIRRALRRLRRDLFLIDTPNLLRSARRERLQRMQRDLASLWYTDPASPRKPTVLEELDRTLFAVRTLWRVGPRLMQKVRPYLSEGETAAAGERPILSFGNWIGGDRDGNPFVTLPVTRRSLETLRGMAIRLHRRQCRAARERLTVSAARCGLPEELRQAIDQARTRWPELAERLDRLHPNEWIVQWLAVIDFRLSHSHALPDHGLPDAGYRNAEDLARDVDRVHESLIAAGSRELAAGVVRRWRDRIGMFGLHLTRLDLRVNSASIAETIEAMFEAMGEPGAYLQRDDAGRREKLTAEAAERAAGLELDMLPATARDLVGVLTLYHRLAGSGYGEALGQVIISMTHQPSDVLSVVWLMRVAARAVGDAEPAALPVVPLFETIDDLGRADGMLEAVLSETRYRRHVERCGGRQTCMIGYSDSAKDGGYLASNWALFRTQERLTATAARHGVTLGIFHGRGGALGRGGGPAARAILSLPPEAIDARLRLTEQGEIIAERYDDPAIAERHLEQLIWATLMVSRPGALARSPNESLAKELADRSLQSYRDLINDPAFGDYLRHCTALPLVENLAIGSRPSRRAAAAGFQDLRAIPFTFAWNQVRVPINAFYGLGAAFESLAPEQQRQAAELYETSPWFAAVIDNAELALARCDPQMARHYLPLAPDAAAAERVWQRLQEEHGRACAAVTAIKREVRLIEQVPWLRRTIEVRSPYLDILNLIQVELLTRRRVEREEDGAVDEGLRQTVQAIASGLRNTG